MSVSPRPRRAFRGALAGFVALPLVFFASPERATDGLASPGSVDDGANQCESLTGAAINDWNQNVKPDIEAVVNGVDAAGSLIRTTERGSLGAQATRAVTGQTPSQMVGQVMQNAVSALVASVQAGPWSQIGPRALDLPGTATGRITPVVGTTRMFITPPNLTNNRARITITKTDGRQRAEVVVCKAPWDNPGNYTRVRVIEFDNGLANVGETQTVNIANSYGWYFTVKVRKFVGANAFEYRVRAEPTGRSRVD